MIKWLVLNTSLLWLISACSITRPCAEGGDVSWPTDFKGDRYCQKTKLKDGKIVNHGVYKQYYPEGRIVAVEGQFLEGEKDGFWYEFDPKGKKKLMKYYQRGMEMAPPAEAVATQKK